MKSVYSVVLLASILLLSTASVANIYAQEYNDDDIKKESYGYDNDDNKRYDEKSYYLKDDYYKPHKDGKKKDPLVTIEKELFVCENIRFVDHGEGGTFACTVPDEGSNIAAPPNDERYVECTEDRCPGIDESTFAAFLHKDLLFLQDLNSDGTTVALDKFHYTISEDEPDDRTGFGLGGSSLSLANCEAGFDEDTSYVTILERNGDQILTAYDICVLYDGDCQGTLHPGDEKTCTIKNYIVAGLFSVNEGNENDEPIP